MPASCTILDSAVAEWTDLLGSEFVIADSGTLEAAETATFATTQSIPVILRPGTRYEVQECLRIAQRERIPVYPVSTGMNWGYGSRVPAATGCALMELGRMNRILDYDEDLAYVTIEPGVTQTQLVAFLRAQGSRLWIDATGSSPHSSLIGNTVERGFGHTPYGDHFANVCGLEIVLPNGECVETGFARFANARTAATYKWGVGPSIDGLFTQSNFGIVTRMTVWLMPAPEYFQAYFFRCDDPEGVASLVDAMRPLRLNGTVRSAVHIGNDYKVLSSIQRYPWDQTRGETPLRPEQMPAFRQKYNFGVWNGSGGLYGTRRQVAEARRLIKRGLQGKVSKLQFLDERMLDVARRFAKPYQWVTGWDLSRTIELVTPVFGLMRGEPTDKPLASTYWRKRIPLPATYDPDRDRCGLLWCAPTAPLSGSQTRTLVDIANGTLLGHGFEPMLSLTLITERTLACVITIAFDRDCPGEDAKALTCYRDLLGRLTEAGYYSYRLGIQSMTEMSCENGYNRFLRLLKDCVDPENILSPGRYEPRRGAAARG
jgi:4-cresol dehydrogenase (hydroxylating) flavoprotein subunit